MKILRLRMDQVHSATWALQCWLRDCDIMKESGKIFYRSDILKLEQNIATESYIDIVEESAMEFLKESNSSNIKLKVGMK